MELRWPAGSAIIFNTPPSLEDFILVQANVNEKRSEATLKHKGKYAVMACGLVLLPELGFPSRNNPSVSLTVEIILPPGIRIQVFQTKIQHTFQVTH